MTDDEFNELFIKVMEQPLLSRDVILLIGEFHRRLTKAQHEKFTLIDLLAQP